MIGRKLIYGTWTTRMHGFDICGENHHLLELAIVNLLGNRNEISPCARVVTRIALAIHNVFKNWIMCIEMQRKLGSLWIEF